MERSIDMKRKGCKSIGCYTHFVTFNFDLNHDKFWKSHISGIGWPFDMEQKGCELNRMLDPCCDFQLWPYPSPWPWIFEVKYWNCCISGMGGLIHFEWKGCELYTMLDAQWDWPLATTHGKSIGQVMGQCETLTVSNLLSHKWAIRSLILGLRGVVVLWTPCFLG